MIAVQIQNVTDFNSVSTSVKTTGRVTSNTGYKPVHQLSLPAKTVHHILSKNRSRDLMVFMWLSFLGFWEIRHMVLRYMYINLLLVNTGIMYTYSPLDRACEINCVLQLHVFACLHVHSWAKVSLPAKCFGDTLHWQ